MLAANLGAIIFYQNGMSFVLWVGGLQRDLALSLHLPLSSSSQPIALLPDLSPLVAGRGVALTTRGQGLAGRWLQRLVRPGGRLTSAQGSRRYDASWRRPWHHLLLLSGIKVDRYMG